MKADSLQRMLDFLDLLRARQIRFRIERQSPDALMVTFIHGTTCFEIDFFVDDVWFSRFSSVPVEENTLGGIERIIAQHWDD